MTDTEAGSQPADTTTTDPGSEDEPLGETGLRALESERERRRAAVQRATEAEARVAELEAGNLRSEIATKTDVPADLLSGTTREELETSAKRLREFRGDDKAGVAAGKPKEKLRGGASPPDTDVDDVSRIADRIISG